MNMAWRAIHTEMTRAKVEREAAIRVGASFAAALGVQKAADFCARHKIPVKAAGEATNSPGGFLVGDEVEDAILAFRSLMGVIRREGGVRGMGSDTRTFPRSIGGVTASFVGENQEGGETEGAFDGVKLHARKAMALTRASSELFEDALADIGAWLVEELGSALTLLEDNCGWLGDGSGSFGKMLGIAVKLADGNHAGGVAAGAGHDMLSKVDGPDIAALMAKLPEQYHPGAKFYANSAGMGALTRLGATPFGSVETAYGVRPLLQLGGYEIVPAAQLAGATAATGKVMLAFGDMRKTVIFGDRRGITVKVSGHRHIERDQFAVRATARFEIVAHNLGDAANPGSMVGLLGA